MSGRPAEERERIGRPQGDAHQQWWLRLRHSAAFHHRCGEAGRARLALIGSALGFSLMGICVKKVGGRLPVAEVVLARALVSVSLSWLMVRAAGLSPWGQRRGLLALRGILGCLALWCLYGALTLLPLASATLLQYLYPSLTALIAWLWLRERPSRGILLATLLGWLGVVLVAHPTALIRTTGLAAAGPPLPIAGVVLAISGALLTALAYVSVRSLSRSEPPLVIVFWFPLVAALMSLPVVLRDPVLPRGEEWLWLLGVGLFTQLGQLGLTAGLARLPAARATAISYSQVAFAGLWGWLLFAETPDVWTSLGALLILAAVLVGR